jgi:uncharacterized protein (TIGR02231 family)
MKILHTLLLISFVHVAQAAEDSVFTKARLSQVAVYYLSGAELQHQARVALKPGLQYVVIDQLSHRLDEASLRLGCPDQVTILSWQHSIYTPEWKPVSNPLLEDSIRNLRRLIADTQHELQLQEELLRKLSALVDNNFTTPDKKNIQSPELIRLSEYYLKRIMELKNAAWAQQVKRDRLNEQLTAMQQRLNLQPERSGPQPKSTGRLVLQVMAPAATSASFDVHYFTPHAGWIPTYDMRLKTFDQSFVLGYKAAVHQQTGIDWEGVPLTLTTQNPSSSGIMPVLNPSYLQLYVAPLYTMMEQSKAQGVPALRPSYDDKETDASGEPSNVAAYTNMTENLINITYQITLPYNIPSNGNAYTINIKDEKITAQYRHMSIPKLDRDAYFTANLTGWNALNLLPGESNIIIDNMYMGKSFINPNIEADTLSLSLGKDKRIAISRLPVKEFTSVSTKNDIQTSTYTYEITVKNNKNKAVSLSVYDQFPLSREKEVQIKLLDAGGAAVNAETGMLTWVLELEPGATRKIRFSYQVKIPAGKKVRELRQR